MKSRFQPNRNLGFTLIEMIVSLALFSVVVTVAVGALLMLVGANDELQQEQSVMTSLSFALDSMSREIRTGTSYFCDTRPSSNGNNIFNDALDLDTLLGTDQTSDCFDGRGEVSGSSNRFHGVAFIEAGDSITGTFGERILYYYNAEERMIYRRVGAENAIPILSGDIRVVNADFFVSSGDSLTATGDLNQPAVTIHIEAQAANNTDADPQTYFVQTTIAQRILDL